MSYLLNFKDCRILIKDPVTNHLLADTTVSSYDPHSNKVRIYASRMTVIPESRPVQTWIFTGKTIYEYSGRLRHTITDDEVEIALYAGHTKEYRENSRYKIEASGIIEGIIIGTQRIRLRKPIEIMTRDISRNGILFEAMAESLECGSAFMLALRTPVQWYRNEYQVVRIHKIGLEREAYGCQIFLE